MGGLCSTPPEAPPNPTHVDLTHFTLLKVVGQEAETETETAAAAAAAAEQCALSTQPPPHNRDRRSTGRKRMHWLTHVYAAAVCRRAGKGGFGKVNAIQRRSNGELCALKRMGKAEVIKKESHIRMIWTERRVMSRLSSPFLVNLMHAFQDDRELYFCMPFMQGGDLRFHLSKLGCLSEADAKFYAAQILMGLESMHALNIVYRDLSTLLARDDLDSTWFDLRSDRVLVIVSHRNCQFVSLVLV